MVNPLASILVVEDEESARRNLARVLKKQGFDVEAVDSGARAIERLESREFDIVITDYKMGNVDGIQVLEKSRQRHPFTEVIMITGYATVDMAVAAMRHGAFHYLAKPCRIDAVRRVVAEALGKRRQQLKNWQLHQELDIQGPNAFLMGRSTAMRDVQQGLPRIAATDACVMLYGRPGTGKEPVARAIHARSARAGNPFLVINCTLLSKTETPAQLTDPERKPLGGVDSDMAGWFKDAAGGAIFFDQVQDMPLSMQSNLLQVLDEPLDAGGKSPVSVNVRLFAAANRDLREDVSRGGFRQDLYYRLSVLALHLPPLVQRDGDVLLLALHFLDAKCRTLKKAIRSMDRETQELLCQYSWPGNVRELENVIEQAVALENGPVLRAENLPDTIRNLSGELYRHRPGAVPTLEEQEKRYIGWVLEKCQGNKTQAAKLMGIDRVSLWRKIKRYGLISAD
jgi:DNA-binding NtrC family response regulator